jgi:hypothetical protein
MKFIPRMESVAFAKAASASLPSELYIVFNRGTPYMWNFSKSFDNVVFIIHGEIHFADIVWISKVKAVRVLISEIGVAKSTI